MTVGVKLTARLIVVLALINYSYGISLDRTLTAATTTTTATTTTVASNPASLTISTVADETALTGGASSNDTLPSTTNSATTGTPTTTTTKGTPPDGYLEPDFDAAPPFKMTFSIGYDIPWNERYRECSSDPDCQAFQERIQTEIDLAFIGCPGYENGSIAVIKFDSVASEVPAAQFVDANNRSANSTTYASYNASFDNVIILTQGADVVSHIDLTVEVTLASYPEVVDGSTDGMDKAASAQVTAFTENPCASIGTEICPALCYNCSKGDAYPTSVGCQSPCRTDDQTCTIDEQNNIGCTCKAKYLPFGEDCVHENLIIGICAGVGGAIVLGLIILAIVLGCELHKKNKKDKHNKHHEVESQSHRPENYEILGHAHSDRALNNINGIDHHDKDHHSIDVDSTDLATFSRNDHDDHPSTAAAAIAVAAAVDDDHHHHHHHHQHHHEAEAKHVGLKDESHLGSNLHEAADYDNASTDSLDQHHPGPSKTEPDNRQSDYYRSLYYPMPDDHAKHSGHEDPYNSFKPRVFNIDADKQYVIKRPRLQPDNGNHYDYNN